MEGTAKSLSDANAKLKKILVEWKKATAKREAARKKEKEWEEKYREQENITICETVRFYHLTPEKLTKYIEIARKTMPESPRAEAELNGWEETSSRKQDRTEDVYEN